MIEVLATHITIGWAHPRLVSELYPGVLTVEGTRGVILVLNYSHHIVPLPEGERRAFTVDDETLELGAQRYINQVEQGSVAKIVKLEHAWRRLDGRNDDGFQVAPFPG